MQNELSSIKEDIFRDTPKHLIADVIAKNYPNARITDKLIESYIDLSLTRAFTLDETINDIRAMNPYSNDINGKLSFVLNDSSIVAIDESTFVKIKESINNSDITQFMCKSKQNFMDVIDILGE